MKLALFFTRNVSLKLWLDSGLFDREKLIYQKHLDNGNLQKVYWLTYGKNDAVIASQLKSDNRLGHDITVLPIPRFFCSSIGRLLYSFLIPLVHCRKLKSVNILKTNQVDGSWSAVIAKWLYKKPLIVRSGYTLSLFAQKKKRSKLKIKIAEWIERLAYKSADIAVVASSHDKRYICSKYSVAHKKFEVLYNYIDTQLFCPAECEKYADRILFVGRLEPQKNLVNLIEAISETNLTLDICGKGTLGEQLVSKAKELNVQINFIDVVPNYKLPEILNRYKYYVLPSVFEGMPKSLLEAMACGLVCIETEIDGVNEIIEDSVNGYLANNTSVRGLADAINRAIQLSSETITAEAVQTIRDKFSIETIVEQEKELFESLMP